MALVGQSKAPQSYLYNFTLQKSASISSSAYGNFSGPKAQEIVVARGSFLELLSPDENGKVQTLSSMHVFGIIRSLSPFRLTGGTKDYVVVGSDSGRIVILEYNGEENRFEKVHEETFGRSGTRRIVPGEYIATDPKGRAVLIGALEKQKFVYILNRDTAANLTISSPLEAHSPNTILFDIVGVDVGFENPLFAALEFDYEDADGDPTGEALQATEKYLTFYELDLGLNHCSRQTAEPVPMSANKLLSVPGSPDGPGGVIILCEDQVIHRTIEHEDVSAVIPRRRDVPREEGVLITSAVLVQQRDWFFFLVQNESGDLFKVWLDYDGDDVSAINVKYFDTIPVASTMSVLKTGFLFSASEAGDHCLYQFQGIGEDDEDVTLKLTDDDRIFFRPRLLKNLVAIDTIQNAFPITDMLVENFFGEETPQIVTACGTGARSSLRVLRHGLAVSEKAVSQLPGIPSAVWTLKTHITEEFDKYIIVSFKDATMVLSVGETVEEVHDSGFLLTATTLGAGLFGENSLVQVYPGGLRHIRADKRIQEWKPPAGKQILRTAINTRQIALSLRGGEVIYFELDASGQISEIDKLIVGQEVTALALAPVPEGRQRTRFLAVADSDNKTRIYSLNPTDCLQSLAMQVLPATVHTLVLLEMASYGGTSLYVNMGLINGVLIRSTIDRVTGSLTDTRARFLGSRPVKLFPVSVGGLRAVLALSSRSWLLYNHQRRFTMNPLSYVPLEYASSFQSEQALDSLVSISGDSLRIFTVEQLDQTYNHTVTQLRYTPRKMIIHPRTRFLIVAESDHHTYPAAETAAVRELLAKEDEEAGRERVKMEIDGEEGEAVVDVSQDDSLGRPRAPKGRWNAAVRILDVVNNNTLQLLELGNNEHITCMKLVDFANHGGETFLVVGTCKDLVFEPVRKCSEGFLRVYRFDAEATSISLVHITSLPGAIPGAICPFYGRLLVGVGPLLRIYDLGKKKLLRKAENKDILNHITDIQVVSDKIVVSNIQYSYQWVKYNLAQNTLYVIADDPLPRWLTTTTILDNLTIAGGDKFGNVFSLRLPPHLEKLLHEDPSGGAVQWNTNKKIAGAPHKLDMVNCIFVGETISKLLTTRITPGGHNCILYATVSGTIGALVPFQTREDIDFFSTLEMHLREEYKPLCGRDHRAYRSYFAPVRNVVDGDLCELFAMTSHEIQAKIASDLDRNPSEVQKKLEDIRNAL